MCGVWVPGGGDGGLRWVVKECVTVLHLEQCYSVTPGVGRVITLSIQGAARKGGQLYTPAA